jgi:RNA polymerase sigma factor (sigma-70 family)
VYEELEDAALIALCRSGREAAWSTLVRRYQRLVYTVPRRAGLDDEAAADVFQATFARLIEHLHRLDDASRVRAWLVTTAKREALRALEQRARRVELVPERSADGDEGDDGDPFDRMASPDPLPEALLAELQELDRMRHAVERLEPRQRQLIELLFFQEDALPYNEIARRLGIPEGSIGPTRARVLAKLRALMAPLPPGGKL